MRNMLSKNKKYFIVLLLVFLFASFIYINPKIKSSRSQFHSSELIETVSEDDNKKRIDYVDSNGQITIAADKGYATIVTTKTENRKLEQYYDDQGKPINRYNGYYGLLQEYDDQGNNTRTTYLDINGKPMIMANGFAIEAREYNGNRQVVSVRYFDTEENPIQTPLYGYGKINEYDEAGRICRIIYIDASGNPMMIGQGYASATRNYYAPEEHWGGKVKDEFYFDEEGNPISLSLGQYGVHKEYDKYGRESLLTYLDQEGNPIVTTKGYTTIARTYHANGSIATEKYYDLNGNPYALSEGQYGFQTNGNQTIYLDQNGKEQFNLKNLLYNHPWIAVLAALFVIILSSFANKKWNILFLIIYTAAILYMTLMFREDNGTKTPEFLWYYKKIFTDSEARADIIKNIWLFIPLGSILYQLYPKKIPLLMPFILSLLIEGIQYFTGRGICELDDVISNGIGGMIGFYAGCLMVDIKQRIRKRNTSSIRQRV